MYDFGFRDLAAVVTATGGLGVAAFGIVESLKGWSAWGEWGFKKIPLTLGPLWSTYEVAYGRDFEALLCAQYRGDEENFTRTLRQGIRIGLTPQNAKRMAQFLGNIDPEQLSEAAEKAAIGKTLPDEARNTIGRFELAADTRIDAAISLARSKYAGYLKLWASAFSIAIALVVGLIVADSPEGDFDSSTLIMALVVGIAAVPLAPIAKDLSKAIISAGQAIQRR